MTLAVRSKEQATVHKKRFSQRVVRQNLLAWILLLPTLLFLTLFTFYPFAKTIVLSFFTKNLSTPAAQFSGLQNYVSAFRDPVFIKVLLNNLRFSVIVVPICLGLGVLLAYLLNSERKGIAAARAAIFYPNVSPMIGFSLVWVFLLTPQIGFVDNIVRRLGGPSINWIGDPKYVLYAISFVYIWREAGFLMIFFLSGMQGISREYYEAAIIDGVNEWQKFWKITLPLLMPTMVFAVTLSIINSVKMVDSIIVMTGGGPDNASSLLMFYIYKTAFTYWDQGQAAALSVIMLAVVLLLTALQYGVLDRHTHYES